MPDTNEAFKQKQRNRVKYGFIWVILSAILWGASYVGYEMLWTSGGLVPAFESESNYMEYSIVISSISSLLFALVTFFIWVIPAGKAREVARTITKPRMALWLGIATIFGGILATFGSVMATGGLGTTLAASASIMSVALGAIISWLYNHEKIDKKTILGIVAIIIGGIIILDPGSLIADIEAGGTALGLIGLISCVIGWGTEGCIAVRVLDITDSDSTLSTKLIIDFSIWALILLPVAALFFGFDHLYGLFFKLISDGDVMLWLMVIALCMSICYASTYKAFPLIGVARTAALNCLYAPASLIFLAAFFGRIPEWTVIFGVIIGLLGVYLMYGGSDSILEGNRTGAD